MLIDTLEIINYIIFNFNYILILNIYVQYII